MAKCASTGVRKDSRAKSPYRREFNGMRRSGCGFQNRPLSFESGYCQRGDSAAYTLKILIAGEDALPPSASHAEIISHNVLHTYE